MRMYFCPIRKDFQQMLIGKETKNIIFDLGGILLDIDYQTGFNAFNQLSRIPIEEYFTRHKQTRLFDLFETGRIEEEEFRKGLRELLEIEVSDEQLDEAWNAMLLYMPEERLEILKKLRKTHRIFLLSNTNKIHIDWIDAYLEREHKLDDFKGLFETAWYSYEVGLRKPGTEIYRFALEEAGLDPNETVFIDDTLPNVEGSLKAGLPAIHLQRGILPEDFGL